MSFIGRIGNLAKGAWITQTSQRGDALSEEELQKELDRPKAARPATRAKPRDAKPPAAKPAAPRPPERDEFGNIKKTL